MIRKKCASARSVAHSREMKLKSSPVMIQTLRRERWEDFGCAAFTPTRAFSIIPSWMNRRVKGYFDLQELGRLDDAGNIVLMGREHDLIIRGGQNIFPADIEAILSQHPKIVEVAVVGIPDAEMGERVCAFVVCGGGNPIDLLEIKTFLEEKGLARFKWPERVELVKSLPRVASGYKIDKKKLKEIFAGSAASN